MYLHRETHLALELRLSEVSSGGEKTEETMNRMSGSGALEKDFEVVLERFWEPSRQQNSHAMQNDF